MKRCAAKGGKVLRTKVGDRYVIEAMMKQDLNVGGEQSGHMIFRDFSTTGDGIVSALQILRIMVETGKPLSELKRCLTKYPQAQRNLKVPRKAAARDTPASAETRQGSRAGPERRGPRPAALLRHRAKDPPAHRRPRRDRINAQADRIASAIQDSIGDLNLCRNQQRFLGIFWTFPLLSSERAISAPTGNLLSACAKALRACIMTSSGR